ncbi:substance-P receptor-like [Montipora foliosa]|uniref:substance-P receptor-like n=1 Tax=Montipora foliosa TaxID=591990 RepID=UPI0035F1B3B9
MASNETVESILSSSSFTNSAATATEGGYVDNLPVWVHHFGFALYVIFLVLVFFVDTAILFVFCRLKELRNITNNLLCNMVAADLLFALQTPVEGISILHDMWEWGNDLCRFHRFLLHTFYNVVILSLTFVSIERYFAICQPMRFKKHEVTFRCGRLILVAWISSMILSVPQLFLSSVHTLKGKRVCMEERPEHFLKVFLAYHVPMFVALYLLPILTMCFTYVKVSKQLNDVVGRYRQRSRFDICSALKMRRNIMRMLWVVFLVFVVCLTPLTFLELLHVTPVIKPYDPFGAFTVCVGALAFSHALFNPLVSSFMSKEFRKAAKRAFNCPKKPELCKFKHKASNNNDERKQTTLDGVNKGSKPEKAPEQDEGSYNKIAVLSFETVTESTYVSSKED